MSEIINNREYRQKVLKELVLELHAGKSPEAVKERFAKLIEGVSPTEISEMEQNLIMEGMPVEEVQRLCDVHAAVFKGSIAEIHHPEQVPGHPLHTFKAENGALEALIDREIIPHLKEYRGGGKDAANVLLGDLNRLGDIDKHYSRKENLLFPYLEKAGITAPPKVMWGVDDEIRAALKAAKASLHQGANRAETAAQIESLTGKIKEMIFKEESILFPMAQETLAEDEWLGVEDGSEEIGYCLVEPEGKWQQQTAGEQRSSLPGERGAVRFTTGSLLPAEISAILNHLPGDITFIDAQDRVKYFSQGKDRIFARTKAVIGRNVANCHPPASVHIVEKMVADFRSGQKDHEDFWIKMGNRIVYIRYFALRDEQGEYLGTLEFTQDIKPIQGLSGEKRLVTD